MQIETTCACTTTCRHEYIVGCLLWYEHQELELGRCQFPEIVSIHKGSSTSDIFLYHFFYSGTYQR
jgi:hypothetical protein